MSDEMCIGMAKANYRNAKDLYEKTGLKRYKKIMEEARDFLEDLIDFEEFKEKIE